VESGWQNRGRGMLWEAAFDMRASAALKSRMTGFERPTEMSWNPFSQGLTAT